MLSKINANQRLEYLSKLADTMELEAKGFDDRAGGWTFVGCQLRADAHRIRNGIA